jgi:hexosaminidase
MKRVLSFVAALLLLTSASAAESVIVPRPVSVIPQKGRVALSAKTMMYVEQASLVPVAKLFASYFSKENGFEPKIVETPANDKSVIALKINKSLGDEEYLLNISKGGISVCGGSEKAVFYGLQSLRQLIFAARNKGGKVSLNCMTIKDKPHFGYRGGMLDVCRYFFSVDDVKKFIDILALHKMNRFHWHLTEDQGWHIEIKKYPELTKVGSVRKETLIGRYGKKYRPYKFDGKPYSGFFTQEEVKEIVRYASERYIDVIPEIDMPGHMVAALASYPHLGCTGGPYEVRTLWGISRDILCAGRESTFEFVEGVLAEVLALFPSKYIHIGGDEAPKHRWKACPECQKRIQEEGLKDEHELQSYFTHRVEKFLAKHGRRLIGWDEILEGGISKTATIMAWRGANRGIKAAQLGNEVIMTPRHYCYLDYANTTNREKNNEPLCGGGNGKLPLTLRKAYSFNPYDQLNEEQRKAIVGVQGNMWTEYVATFDHVQHMVLPRIAALAEVGWTYGEKNYDDFARRMHLLRKLYDKCDYKYAPYFFNGIE